MINQTLSKFRNPNEKIIPLTSPLSEISFILPDGKFCDFDLDHNIIIGRQISLEDNVYKVDLGGIIEQEGGVSREHVCIQKIDNQVFVCDLNSTNGTHLNGSELFPMRNYILKNGDILKLGKVSVEIRLKKEPHRIDEESPKGYDT